WIHLIDLTTGTNRTAFFPRAFYEGGTYSVAYGIDGAILVSGTFEGSGWVPLRLYDPATEDVRNIASINQSSMLTASGDRKYIAIEESNISSGPVDRYSVGLQQIVNGSGTGWFNYEVGINKDGSQVAAPTYGGTFIFNAQMQQIALLGV